MDEQELAGLGVSLMVYAADLFAGFKRRTQRANGTLYLHGLMLDGQRKSMQPMAERLGVDHQQLQQFVTSSTWDHVSVRRRLAETAAEVIRTDAWVIADTGFVKDGSSSPGVARQYSPGLERVNNCQIAVSLHLAGEDASAVVNWRLYLPESWDDDLVASRAAAEAIRARRARSRIPAQERHRTRWRLALEMIDELREWGHPPGVIVADAGYGAEADFRAALDRAGLAYVLEVPAGTEVGTPPRSVRDLATGAARRAGRPGPGGAGEVAGTAVPGSHLWVLSLDPQMAAGSEPARYWLARLPAGAGPESVARWARMSRLTQSFYTELKTELGLDHFEGRSWTGWHRHTTLVAAAQLFLTRVLLQKSEPPGAGNQSNKGPRRN